METEVGSQKSLMPSWSRLLGPVLAIAAIHAAALAIYVGAYGWDLAALVCVDQRKIEQGPFEKIQIGFAKDGYDGQFCYVLAQQPWSPHSNEFIDNPAFRHTRILYPALAWLFSGGDPIRLLWVLPAINLAAIIGLAWLGARLAVHYRQSPWWGCLLPLVLNAGMPALRDLTDPLATAAVCALVTAYLLEWPVWQLVLCAVAAALSREQNVAIIGLVLADALLKKRWSTVLALAISLVLWIGWIITLCVSYEDWAPGTNQMDVPGTGIWYCLTHLRGQHGQPAILNVLGMLLLFVQMVLSVIVVVRAERLTKGIALAGLMLALLAGVLIYLSSWSYVRVLVWMPLGIWLWSIQSERKWPVLLLLPGTCWFVLATIQPWIK